VTGPPHLRRF